MSEPSWFWARPEDGSQEIRKTIASKQTRPADPVSLVFLENVVITEPVSNGNTKESDCL
jgi:hypothetical protein